MQRHAFEVVILNSLLLSAHDFRTPRKASIHFIAEELSRRGSTRFFSLRYSGLSRWTRDARCFLDDRANRVEPFKGVDCFLWKTAIHPFNTRRPSLRPLGDALFRWSMAHPPQTLDRLTHSGALASCPDDSAGLSFRIAAEDIHREKLAAARSSVSLSHPPRTSIEKPSCARSSGRSACSTT